MHTDATLLRLSAAVAGPLATQHQAKGYIEEQAASSLWSLRVCVCSHVHTYVHTCRGEMPKKCKPVSYLWETRLGKILSLLIFYA